MPCLNYDDAYDDACDQLDELSRHACLFATALSYSLDLLQQDLPVSSLTTILIDAGEPADPKFVREAVDWWTKHRKADLAGRKDAEREASLKRRGKSLLAKLSKEDRDALAAFGVTIPIGALAVAKRKSVPRKIVAEPKTKSKK